jgi:hypothetical protein
MIRSAHSARSIIEKKCRERLGQIIRKAADLLTLKGHQGRFFFCEQDFMGHRWPKVEVI